jgi:hypothetical protein
MGCGSDKNNAAKETSDTAAVAAEVQIDDGFYNIPSPVQQVLLLQQAGASYDKSLLNPLDNVSKYLITNSKALNLGVYGADIGYAAVFNQPQDVILYLSVCKKLSEPLGIKENFYFGIMQRIDKNKGSKDSLMTIVSDLFRRSNASLKENDLSHVSALVVAGSFIEGMYIGTQTAKKAEDKQAIYNRIGEFKDALNNLVGLITTVHDVDFADILIDLRSIKAIYDQVAGSKLSADQISQITKQVKAVRIKITNM